MSQDSTDFHRTAIGGLRPEVRGKHEIYGVRFDTFGSDENGYETWTQVMFDPAFSMIAHFDAMKSRYDTRDDAEAGHRNHIDAVQSGKYRLNREEGGIFSFV